jgi:alkylhydroperoxidase/carboxymuconolactone decarboxylase family protein YurZ
MKAFSALAQAAGRDGALDRKTKELIALAIAIATRCDGFFTWKRWSGSLPPVRRWRKPSA